MKKLTICLVVLLAHTAVGVHADPLTASITRRVLERQHMAQATVAVTATLKKPVYMSDLMFRPVHGKDEVVSYNTQSVTCRGTLNQTGTRVYVPAVCVAQEDYNLEQITLRFSNGKTAVGTAKSVAVTQDVAFVRVQAQATQGLKGLAFAAVPNGQSLQEAYGESLGEKIIHFFRQGGVPERRHNTRMGSAFTLRTPSLKVGDPFLYKGHVVALVQQVPSTFRRGIFGGVSEDYLALIRN